MTEPTKHRHRTRIGEVDETDVTRDPWWSWPLGIAGATVLIVWPQWSVVLALLWGFAWAWFEDIDLGTNPDEISWSILGLAFTYFGLEFLFWLVSDSQVHAFTELLFPTGDSPLDFRLSFVGWLLFFRAIAGFTKARLP